MFNEAMSWKILLPSLGNVNDCVMHVYSKYTDLDGKIEFAYHGEKLCNASN